MKKILFSLLVPVILIEAILSSQFIAMAAGDLNKESIMEEYNQVMAQKDTYIDSLGMTFGEATVELSKLSEQYYNAGSDEEQDSIFTQMDIIYKALNTTIEYSGSDYEQIAYERKLEAEENEKKEQNNEFAKILQKFMGYSQKSGIAQMGVEEHIIHPDGTETVVICTISDEDKKEIIHLLDDIIDNDYIKIASKENLRQFSYDVHFMEVNLTQMNENGVYDEVLTKIQEVQEILNSDKSNTKAEEITSNTNNSKVVFIDVKETDWFYSQVMAMTEKGLFEGKGNNMFCPNDTMTRAEFITVVVRALYPDADMTLERDQVWWEPVYEVATDKGLITESEFPIISIEQTIPRQEMALISVRALKVLGETDIKSYTYIPDINVVNSNYKDYVSKAYGAGIIVGDEKGNFNPQNTLTRAEASTVLYRIIEKSARASVNFDLSAPITIYEGQARYNRNAQEGDLFIKKDGTQIVLKKGPNGILGEGQGVAPDVGLLGQVTENGCDSFTYKVADYGSWYDSTGMRLQNGTYWINETTGEGYWSAELSVLEKKYPALDRDENPGSYEGQVSSDPYSLYVWDGSDWELNFTRG